MKKADFGSVSSGTMRNQDLIPAFCSELRSLGHRSKLLTRIESRFDRAINGEFGEDDEYFQNEVCYFDLKSLCDMLQEHAPQYAYFGSHPGDGADYGFWLSEEFESEYDGLKVDDLSKVSNDYRGEFLEINEHGNMTLYWKSSRKLTEIWSLV